MSQREAERRRFFREGKIAVGCAGKPHWDGKIAPAPERGWTEGDGTVSPKGRSAASNWEGGQRVR
jgi:hypothetical protein